MKKLVLVLAAAAFMVALPSCKKCTTCKYTYTGFNYEQELCGKKSEVDAFESSCKTAATAAGVSCTCSKS